MKNNKLSNILNKKSGNSLMEFAVTIGLMAILAATAAPKLSQMGEIQGSLNLEQSSIN